MKSKLLFLFVLLLSITSKATNYFINDASLTGDVWCSVIGNDSKNGLSRATPKLTLTNLLSTYASLNPGDTVFIDAGTYKNDRNINFYRPGIVFIGAGPTLTTFDNDNHGTSTDYCLYIQASNVTIKNMGFVGYENNGTQGPGAKSGQAVTFDGPASGDLVESVMFYNNGRSGGNASLVALAKTSLTVKGGGGFCNVWATMYTGGVGALGKNINLTIQDYILAYNFKGGFNGAGLLIDGDNTTHVVIKNTRIFNNTAKNGGAICMYDGDLKMYDCLVYNNSISDAGSSNVYGAGLYINAGTCSVSRCKFSNNTVGFGTLKGGAIAARYFTTGTYSTRKTISLSVDSCIFSSNGGGANGKDIYAASGFGNACNITVLDCDFQTSGNYNIVSDGSSPASSINISYSGNPTNTGSNITLVNTSPTHYYANPSPPGFSGDCSSGVTLCISPSSPIVGTITQPTCNIATGSVKLSGLPTPGTWTITAFPGGVTMTGVGDTATFVGLAANNTYSFTVKNSSGCTSGISTPVASINSQPTTPAAPIIGIITQPTCSLATGSVALSGMPSSGTWTVTATPSNATTTGVGPTTSCLFSGLTDNTTYTFKVTNSSGCTSLSSTNAPINPQPLTPTAPIISTITQPNCTSAIGSIALSGLPSSGSWIVTASPGGATITGLGSSGLFPALIANTNYTFTVTASSNCTSVASANTFINLQPTTPTITITSPAECALNLLSYSLGLSASTGVISSTAGVVTNVSGNDWSITGINAGVSITVTVTGANTCVDSISVTAPDCSCPVLIAPVSSGNKQYCEGTAIPTISATVLTGEVVDWYNAATGGVLLLANSSSYLPASAGTYYAETRNTINNCKSSTRTVIIVTMNSAPTAPISNGNITQCEQTPIQILNANTALNNSTGVTWFDATIAGNSVATPILNSTGVATYYAEFNNGTCSSLTRTGVVLTINAAPLAPLSSGDIIQCEQGSIQTLDANTSLTSITGITWYDMATSGSIVATPTLSSTGTITYYAEYNNGICSSLIRTPVVLTINSAPIPPLSSGDITECEPAPIQTLNANVSLSSATGITWYDAAFLGNIVFSPTLNIVDTIPYYAEYNNGTCTSLTRTRVILTITAAPAAPSSSGNITQCEQNPIQTINANNALASASGITWYDALTNGNTVAAPTLNTIGNVIYYAEYNNGTCSSLTRTPVVLTIKAAPAAPIVGTIIQPTCSVALGSILLSGLPASGNWTVTETTNNTTTTGTGITAIFNGLTAGTYSFTVTNSAGCISALSVSSATINAQPSLPVINSTLISFDPANCGHADGNITGISVSSGTIPYSYSWLDNSNQLIQSGFLDLSNVAAGSYYLIVTDALGCKDSTSTLSLSDNTGIQVSLSGTPLLGTAPLISSFTATATTTPLNYNWNFGDGTLNSSINNTTNNTYNSAGNYTASVYVIDANGCSDTSSIQLIVKEEIKIIIPNVFTPNGDGNNDEFTIIASGLKDAKCIIFDRWGLKMVELNGTDLSWDGSTKMGNHVTDGTYYFILTYTTIDNITEQIPGQFQVIMK